MWDVDEETEERFFLPDSHVDTEPTQPEPTKTKPLVTAIVPAHPIAPDGPLAPVLMAADGSQVPLSNLANSAEPLAHSIDEPSEIPKKKEKKKRAQAGKENSKKQKAAVPDPEAAAATKTKKADAKAAAAAKAAAVYLATKAAADKEAKEAEKAKAAKSRVGLKMEIQGCDPDECDYVCTSCDWEPCVVEADHGRLCDVRLCHDDITCNGIIFHRFLRLPH